MQPQPNSEKWFSEVPIPWRVLRFERSRVLVIPSPSPFPPTAALPSLSPRPPILTLDTRAIPTGDLTGLVQGGGKPVANAQARIDGTIFAASTDADSRFTLANVSAASGCLLKVSAAGFASTNIVNVPGLVSGGKQTRHRILSTRAI